MISEESNPDVYLFDFSETRYTLGLDNVAGYLTLNGIDLCRVNEKVRPFYGRVMTQPGHFLDPYSLRKMDVSRGSLTNSTNSANRNLLDSIGYAPFQLGDDGARLHTRFTPELSLGAELSKVLKNASIDQIVAGDYLTELDAKILSVLNRIIGKTYTIESIISELSEDGREVDGNKVVEALERINHLKKERVRAVSRFAFRGTDSGGVFFWDSRNPGMEVE